MPIAIGAAPAPLATARSSRRRRWIAVTMRPRRLSTPAISAPASGTGVMWAGLKTSCTRSIGKPNSCPAAAKVTYSVMISSCRSSLSRRPIEVGALLLDRCDQSRAVELGDKIVEPDGAPALDRLVRNHRCKRNDRYGARSSPYQRAHFFTDFPWSLSIIAGTGLNLRRRHGERSPMPAMRLIYVVQEDLLDSGNRTFVGTGKLRLFWQATSVGHHSRPAFRDQWGIRCRS